MLENLRRKSLSKTYNDPIHQIYFEQGHVIYQNLHYSMSQHPQRMSTKETKKSFPKFFTISKGFWGVVEHLQNVEFNMICCPMGTFIMGHKDRENNPLKQKTIAKSFLLAETEITQELYKKVMGKNPSHFQNRPKNPVENVSWDDAILFCNELSRLQGLELCYTANLENLDYGWDCDFNKNGYRLPTEKEWEYAAKASTQNQWAGTNLEYQLSQFAWYGEEKTRGSTHLVKTKRPNEWGFRDMSGNVWEWCWDIYSHTPKKSHIIRGGSWDTPAWEVHSAEHNGSQYSDDNIGFRIARTFGV